MANTSIPIEISTEMHTALTSVVASLSYDVYVYARGVKTDEDGNADSTAVEIRRKCPMVDVIPHERTTQQHNSRLQSYPVRVRVVTYGPDDPFYVAMYEVGHEVGEWLASAPTLNMTLAKFDALVMEGSPDVGELGLNDTLQYMEWTVNVNLDVTP